MTTRRLFNYLGAKRYIAPVVDAVLRRRPHSALHWVEPFCGGASLFYSIQCPDARQNFSAVLNDANARIMSMHAACRNNTYEDYINMVGDIRRRFGDCKSDKEAYYKFRSWWNNLNDPIHDDGLYLIYLSSMCINSMLRFGPHGMNQGWGARESIISEEDWNEMHRRLSNATLLTGGYEDVPIADNCVVFLDPPYEAQKNDLYGSDFSQDAFLEWLRKQTKEHSGCLWLYTDVDSQKADSLLDDGFIKVPLRDMTTTAPGKKKGDLTSREVMYVSGATA